MKFFKKRNKTLKYIERLALENIENKKRIEALETQLTQFTQLGVEMAEQIKELKSCGNIDERLNSLESGMLDRDAVEDIINDVVPLHDIDDLIELDIDRINDILDNYDFDEFMTTDAVDDELEHRNYVTEDNFIGVIDEYISDIKDDIVSDLMKEVKEMQTPKWDDPEQFMLFLNKLAKYVVTQTNNN